MKVYVASSLDNADNVSLLYEILRRSGHTVTYDWTAHGAAYREHESEKVNVFNLCRVACGETRGVLEAEALIVLLPGGKGTHVEIGIALGKGIPIILVGHHAPLTGPVPKDQKHVAFYFHPSVCHIQATPGVGKEILLALERLKTGFLGSMLMHEHEQDLEMGIDASHDAIVKQFGALAVQAQAGIPFVGLGAELARELPISYRSKETTPPYDPFVGYHRYEPGVREAELAKKDPPVDQTGHVEYPLGHPFTPEPFGRDCCDARVGGDDPSCRTGAASCGDERPRRCGRREQEH